MTGKVLYEFALVVCGAQYVTLVGTAKMQLLFVDNWDFQCQVVLINTIALVIIMIVMLFNIAAIPLLTTRSGRGTGTAFVNNFACTGQELSLLSCTHILIASSCSYSYFVGVQCLGKIIISYVPGSAKLSLMCYILVII